MICAIFLAYAGSHSGSSRLEGLSEDIEQKSGLFDSNEEINFEAIGNLPLPESGEQVKEQEAPPVVESQPPAAVIPSEPDPVEARAKQLAWMRSALRRMPLLVTLLPPVTLLQLLPLPTHNLLPTQNPHRLRELRVH